MYPPSSSMLHVLPATSLRSLLYHPLSKPIYSLCSLCSTSYSLRSTLYILPSTFSVFHYLLSLIYDLHSTSYCLTIHAITLQVCLQHVSAVILFHGKLNLDMLMCYICWSLLVVIIPLRSLRQRQRVGNKRKSLQLQEVVHCASP